MPRGGATVGSQMKHWIEWTRTDLIGEEAGEFVAALTPEQRDQLAKEDFVWSRTNGVLFRDPAGRLRRGRFTHGTHFRTAGGEFYIDSTGATTRIQPDNPET